MTVTLKKRDARHLCRDGDQRPATGAGSELRSGWRRRRVLAAVTAAAATTLLSAGPASATARSPPPR